MEKTGFGIKVTHVFNLVLLAFADGLIVFAATLGEMQKKLNRFKEYFESLGLTVNVE